MFICDIKDIDEEYPHAPRQALGEILIDTYRNAGSPLLPAMFILSIHVDGSHIWRMKLSVEQQAQQNHIQCDVYDAGSARVTVKRWITSINVEGVEQMIQDAMIEVRSEYRIMESRLGSYDRQITRAYLDEKE